MDNHDLGTDVEGRKVLAREGDGGGTRGHLGRAALRKNFLDSKICFSPFTRIKCWPKRLFLKDLKKT